MGVWRKDKVARFCKVLRCLYIRLRELELNGIELMDQKYGLFFPNEMYINISILRNNTRTIHTNMRRHNSVDIICHFNIHFTSQICRDASLPYYLDGVLL